MPLFGLHFHRFPEIRLVSHPLARALHLLRFGAVLALAAGIARPLPSAEAAPLKIRVKGTSTIEAHATLEESGTTVRGTLTDDEGMALGAQTVTLSVQTTEGPRRVGIIHAHSCAGEAKELSGEPMRLITDAHGEFCVQGVLPLERLIANLQWSGSSLVEGTETSIDLDLTRQVPRIRFEDAPAASNIDDALDLSLAVDVNGRPLGGATLLIADERDKTLGSWTTGSNGRVRVLLLPRTYGGDGRGEIRASFTGTTVAAPARATLPLDRHARVRLSAQVIKPGDPEEGIETAIQATTSYGAVGSGTIRATIGGTTVGAGPVRAGEARLRLLFATDRRDETLATLTYLPETPWLDAGDSVDIRVPIKKRWPWRQVMVAMGGVAVAAWFALSRKRTVSTVLIPETPVAEARITQVSLGKDQRPVWSGTVIDAHDLHPLGDARVRIERASFDGRHVVAATSTRSDGTFELDAAHAPPKPNDELVIDAAHHAELRRSLPSGGALRIALVTRRRKLLERFVVWAKQHGLTGRGKEPTPGDVRDRSADPAARAWAELVTHAAFDHAGVDAEREAAVERAAPSPLSAQEDPNRLKTVRNSDKSPG